MNVLILGASYGALLASKIALAGHNVTLVAKVDEAERLNQTGLCIRLVAREGQVLELTRSDMLGAVEAFAPTQLTSLEYDLVFLAMQEPQYAQVEVAELMERISEAALPVVSVMNLPPASFLRRLGGFDEAAFDGVYQSHSVWDRFAAKTITAASPDPQAVRIEAANSNALQVTLPTNFKVAPFSEPLSQSKLERLCTDIDRASVIRDGIRLSPRVRLVAHARLFVPLAKWPMLIAGNCRCLQSGAPRTIRDAVWDNLEESRSVYEAVAELCRRAGASDADLVAFEKYAEAARSLTLPSSLARALFNGAKAVERMDKLVHNLSRLHRLDVPTLADTVFQIDQRLASNRLS